MGAVETEGFEVGEDEVALGELVELEFDDLGSVFRGPPLRDFQEGFDRHSAFAVLRHQVLISRRADHKFDFRVELCLDWRRKRNRESGGCWGFGCFDWRGCVMD